MEATTTKLTERDLLVKYRDAKKAKEAQKLALEKATKDFDDAEAALIELLEARNAKATANYTGLGSASLVKPKLYASCLKADEPRLFAYLKEMGREDLVKPAVNASSLSGFVKEKVDEGQEVPPFISYHLEPSLRLNE